MSKTKLDVEYRLGLAPGNSIDAGYKFKVNCLCTCPNKDVIYIYGHSRDLELWISVLVHENFHAVLDLAGLLYKYHHGIMDKIEF